MSTSLSQTLGSRLSPQEIQQYREYFEMFDINGDGVISVRELSRASQRIGYKISSTQMEEIMKLMDRDENGCLTFDEFLLAMPANDTSITPSEHKKAEIRRKFLEYDSDGNGVVTIGEAHDILNKELAFTPQQSIELVRRFDTNGDGHLSYDEFVDFYMQVRSRSEEIKEMFEDYDTDQNGAISAQEAKQMLRKLALTEADIETLIALHDKNKDGQLQYEEFVQFLMHKK